MKAFLPAVFIVVGAAVFARAEYAINEIPKYGNDPEYETIWSYTPESERPFNIANSKHASERGWQYLGKGDAAMALTASNLCTGMPAFGWVAVISVATSAVLIARELRRPDYHGVAWGRINPGLPEWWQKNVGEAPIR